MEFKKWMRAPTLRQSRLRDLRMGGLILGLETWINEHGRVPPILWPKCEGFFLVKLPAR